MIAPVAILALLAAAGQTVRSPAVPQEPTDVVIRRAAGLPAETARGAIEILDVGHHAMETMVSLVGSRRGTLWHVSYACAESPRCAPDADHRAVDYDLSATDSAAVDAVLAELRTGKDPGGMKPSPTFIGGYLVVRIDDGGFVKDFNRVGMWGPVLGRLESLMAGPARLPPIR